MYIRRTSLRSTGPRRTLRRNISSACQLTRLLSYGTSTRTSRFKFCSTRTSSALHFSCGPTARITSFPAASIRRSASGTSPPARSSTGSRRRSSSPPCRRTRLATSSSSAWPTASASCTTTLCHRISESTKSRTLA